MKAKLAIFFTAIGGVIALVFYYLVNSRKGHKAGLKRATESIANSKAKVVNIKKKAAAERKKIRGTSEKDSVSNLNSLDQD